MKKPTHKQAKPIIEALLRRQRRYFGPYQNEYLSDFTTDCRLFLRELKPVKPKGRKKR